MMEYSRITSAANALQNACHEVAWNSGWWTDMATRTALTCNYQRDVLGGHDVPGRNIGELIALIHSELSEALEGARKQRMDDHLPERPSLEVELADAAIRIFDMAGGMNLDLAGAIADKLAYNATRADHRHADRAAAGGKTF